MPSPQTHAAPRRRLFIGRIKSDNERKLYFFFLPVWKSVRKGIRTSYYLFGIRVYRCKKLSDVIRQEVERKLTEHLSDTGQLRQDIEHWLQFRIQGLVNMIHYLHQLLRQQGSDRHILLLDCLHDRNVEAIDAWSFFLYLKSRNVPAKYVLREDNTLAEQHGHEDGVILVKDDWDLVLNHQEQIARASCVLSSFGLAPPLDGVLRQLPFLPYIFIEHGVTYYHNPFAIKIYNPSRFDMVLVPTSRTEELYREQGVWDRSQMLHAGFPRWDLLERRAHPGKNIFIFFTWRKTFINTPNRARHYFAKIHSFLSHPEFRRIVREYGLTVNLALHHALEYNNVDIPDFPADVNIIDSSRISRHIGTSDLLITDYSSICFDFIFLDIPVIFYRFDFGAPHLDDVDHELARQAKQIDPRLYNCIYREEELPRLLEHYARTDFRLEEENVEKNKALFWQKQGIRQALYEELERMGCTPARA